MGHVSIVYGKIIGATWKHEDYHKLQRLNKVFIESLPENDNDFPWINKGMFLIPDPGITSMYRDQVIVFGASYKSVEHEWSHWLEKFENILKNLFWINATIYLETELVGDHKYEWLMVMNHLDNLLSDNPEPVTCWKFKGSSRKFFDDNGRRL